MANLSGKKILILATNGFEQSELEVPRDTLKEAGATVHVASPESGEIKGWDKTDWGRSVKVDRKLKDCHAPWLLIEASVIKGRKVTSYNSIKTDVINAGGIWEDSPVVVDQGLITSRNPGDLKAFSGKIIEEVAEGRHLQRSAA